MTALTRVRRTVDLGLRRPIVVTLDWNNGAPLLWFREKGRRTAFALPLAWCFTQAAKRAAEQLRLDRKAKRKNRRNK